MTDHDVQHIAPILFHPRLLGYPTTRLQRLRVVLPHLQARAEEDEGREFAPYPSGLTFIPCRVLTFRPTYSQTQGRHVSTRLRLYI